MVGRGSEEDLRGVVGEEAVIILFSKQKPNINNKNI